MVIGVVLLWALARGGGWAAPGRSRGVSVSGRPAYAREPLLSPVNR